MIEDMKAYMRPRNDWYAKGLTRRLSNCMANHGIETIEQICELTEAELLTWSNLGRRSLNDLKAWLAAKGLALKGPEKPDPLAELARLQGVAHQRRAALAEAEAKLTAFIKAYDLTFRPHDDKRETQ